MSREISVTGVTVRSAFGYSEASSLLAHSRKILPGSHKGVSHTQRWARVGGVLKTTQDKALATFWLPQSPNSHQSSDPAWLFLGFQLACVYNSPLRATQALLLAWTVASCPLKWTGLMSGNAHPSATSFIWAWVGQLWHPDGFALWLPWLPPSLHTPPPLLD